MEASQPLRIEAIETAAPAPHLSIIAGGGSVAIPKGLSANDRVDRLALAIDWDSYLPDRANAISWKVQESAKRALDIVLSLSLLILLSPLFLLIAVLVKLTSEGPIFYEFRVLGKNARRFVAYKFRTMVQNADDLKPDLLHRNEMRGPAFKMRSDPRVTPLGKWLRKFSLDELPQLWSVVVGDMSLVGPRPPFAEEFVRYEPWQWGRLAVTPGITCIWQVAGRSDICDFNEWATLDMRYIREWNLTLDCKILLLTIPAVLRGRGAY
ncbi:MAG TPA: sugar transferase [Longimicrobiales bacterium]|nr:sugar transferase [Longimicrobiales bacterium]